MELGASAVPPSDISAYSERRQRGLVGCCRRTRPVVDIRETHEKDGERHPFQTLECLGSSVRFEADPNRLRERRLRYIRWRMPPALDAQQHQRVLGRATGHRPVVDGDLVADVGLGASAVE